MLRNSGCSRKSVVFVLLDHEDSVMVPCYLGVWALGGVVCNGSSLDDLALWVYQVSK